jgi:hypothetical protein
MTPSLAEVFAKHSVVAADTAVEANPTPIERRFPKSMGEKCFTRDIYGLANSLSKYGLSA